MKKGFLFSIPLFTFFVCLFFNGNVVFSQKGTIAIYKDARLDQRISEYGEITPPHPSAQINGYRIQLAFEQSKTEIEKLREKFNSSFPKIETYIIYSAPNFFLKAGNFRTKLEAEKIKFLVENNFPTSNVVKEKVYLPKIEE